jgi:hypothetical protein
MPNIASAHFPWLIVDKDAKPVLFFGEDMSDRTYHLPQSPKAFPLQYVFANDESKELDLKPIETEELIGLVSNQPVEKTGCVFGTQTFGNYHGTKLTFFVQHFLGEGPQHWQSLSADMAMKADLQPHDDGIRVTILWNEKPLAETEVRLSSEDGQEQGKSKTDSDGSFVFTGKQLKPGLHAVMAGFEDL